MNIDYIKKYR